MPPAGGLVVVAVLLASAPSRAQDAGTAPPTPTKESPAGERQETKSPHEARHDGKTDGDPGSGKKKHKAPPAPPAPKESPEPESSRPDAVDPCRFHPDAPGCRK